jgi:hypothetical protein
MVVEAGYVGSKSDHLLNDGINNLNVIPLGTMINDPTGIRTTIVRREFGSNLPVTQHTHYQNYNALQVLLSRASSKFSYTAAYTWSKALGIRGGGQDRRPSQRATSATRPTASSATTARTC